MSKLFIICQRNQTLTRLLNILAATFHYSRKWILTRVPYDSWTTWYWRFLERKGQVGPETGRSTCERDRGTRSVTLSLCLSVNWLRSQLQVEQAPDICGIFRKKWVKRQGNYTWGGFDAVANCHWMLSQNFRGKVCVCMHPHMCLSTNDWGTEGEEILVLFM